VRVGWAERGGRRSGERLAEKEVSHGANRRVLVIEGRFIEAERHHVIIDSPIRVFVFKEDAVAATHHRLFPEGAPSQTESGSQLFLVRLRDRYRKSCLAAGLNEIFEQRIRARSGKLRPQVNLAALAANDDGLGGRGVK